MDFKNHLNLTAKHFVLIFVTPLPMLKISRSGHLPIEWRVVEDIEISKLFR